MPRLVSAEPRAILRSALRTPPTLERLVAKRCFRYFSATWHKSPAKDQAHWYRPAHQKTHGLAPLERKISAWAGLESEAEAATLSATSRARVTGGRQIS